MAETKSTRSTRDSLTHDKGVRRKPWEEVRQLDTPPPPVGLTYRWVRESMLGKPDPSNVSRRIREGWEPVRPEELPTGWDLPTMDSGKFSGVIYNDGLLLCKMPTETVDERNAHYARKTQEATESLDNNMFNEMRGGDGRYVKYDPQRDSRVTFGRN